MLLIIVKYNSLFVIQRAIFATLLIIIAAASSAQDINPYTSEPGYEKYHLENVIIKRNRIKYVIDSSKFILPGDVNVKGYDTMGRLIGNVNSIVDSFDLPYVYKINGDTVLRLVYKADRKTIACYERFVRNKKGRLISYLDCCNYYFKDNSYYVQFDEFYYDENDTLRTKLSYFKNDYPGKVSDMANIDRKDLEIGDIIYYSYNKLKNGKRLIIGKHASGKPEWRSTDSTILDQKNRIIHFNSFAKRGAMGEMVQNNVNYATDYKYDDSILTIVRYTTYCVAPLSDFNCADYSTPDKSSTVIVYNKDGTKKLVYGFYKDGKKYVKDSFTYVYY